MRQKRGSFLRVEVVEDVADREVVQKQDDTRGVSQTNKLQMGVDS
jgi:hypothetical protein